MSQNKDRKMAELILYVAQESESDARFGAVKLNKILFWSDFLYYRKAGRSITGQEYMRLKEGPAPRRLVPIERQLIESGDAVPEERDSFPRPQKRVVAKRAPDLSAFDPDEVSMIDWVIRELWDMNGAQVSAESHDFPGWKLAADREEIPYHTIYLSERDLTPEEYDYPLTLGEDAFQRA